jgi:hypothetical protein
MKQQLLANQKKNNREEGGQRSSGGDNASYPFWNIPVGQTAHLRFLPDADPDNVFFWAQREVIKLPFQGVAGGQYPTDKLVTVTVPCVDMFDGMTCPITAAIRPWWKGDEDAVALARKYYKKKSYIFQGFVVASPFEEQTVPENPIRRFVLNPSLYDIVKESLMSPEMEYAPIDFVEGRDFKVSKTQKGEYANYQTSSWSFRTRSLGEVELAAIEKYGLYDLKEYKGPRPDAAGLEIIKAMFQDSLDGKPFDMASFGEHYRPYGSRDSDGGDADAITTAARAAAAVSKPAVAAPQAAAQVESAPAPASAPETDAAQSSGGISAHDLLERIKNRART